MRLLRRLALIASLSLAVPALTLAQATPNFSGTWVLQIAQSDFGQIPAPDSRTDIIDHQEPRLSIKRSITTQGTPTTADLTYAVDGQPHRNMAGPTALVSTLHWEGEILVMVSTAESPQGPLTFTDKYSLGADGKTLTQARTLSIQGQELTQRLVLTKQ